MSSRNPSNRYRFNALSDFVIRKQRPSLWQIVTIFVCVLLVSLIITVLNLDKIPLIIFLFLFLSSLGIYMIVLLQRSRDLVLTTEFQNALFASALDYNRTFCLIIKNDGNIVHMDQSFQRIFSDFVGEGHLSLANFLKYGKAERLEVEKIFNAIELNIGDRIVCTLHGSDGKLYRLVISIEPIPRPAGFLMLHAREFVEMRQEKRVEAPAASADGMLLTKSSLALFSGIMDKMDTGIYVLDVVGTVIYANSTLEGWLDYNENEITYGNLSVSNLIIYGKNTTGMTTPEDFEGEIELRSKNGATVQAYIKQKMILGETKNILGSMAMVSILDPDTRAAR